MSQDAATLYQRALETYYSCDNAGRDNLDDWARRNRSTLLVADGLAKQAMNLAEPNPDILSFLAKVNFDLLEIDRSISYAEHAIKLSPITFDANYVLYLIDLNRYINIASATANSPFGGAAGIGYRIGFGLTRMGKIPSAKRDLEGKIEMLKRAYLGSVRHARATYNGVIYMSNVLIDCYETLRQFKIVDSQLLQLVVNELGALGTAEDIENQKAVDAVKAMAYSMLH